MREENQEKQKGPGIEPKERKGRKARGKKKNRKKGDPKKTERRKRERRDGIERRKDE